MSDTQSKIPAGTSEQAMDDDGDRRGGAMTARYADTISTVSKRGAVKQQVDVLRSFDLCRFVMLVMMVDGFGCCSEFGFFLRT